MARKKTIRHTWERPKLPEGNRGGGMVLGWLMIGFGLVILYGASTYSDGIWIAIICSWVIGIGILTTIVSTILREIRRVAFEATLRAGEVTTEDTS